MLDNVHEIMVRTNAISNLIREDKTVQMYSALQTGQQHGMQTMDQHLGDLVLTKKVAIEDARRVAVDKSKFL